MCREDTGSGQCQWWKFGKAGWGKASRKEMCLLETLIGTSDEEHTQILCPERMQTTKFLLSSSQAMACLSLPTPIYFDKTQ